MIAQVQIIISNARKNPTPAMMPSVKDRPLKNKGVRAMENPSKSTVTKPIKTYFHKFFIIDSYLFSCDKYFFEIWISGITYPENIYQLDPFM